MSVEMKHADLRCSTTTERTPGLERHPDKKTFLACSICPGRATLYIGVPFLSEPIEDSMDRNSTPDERREVSNLNEFIGKELPLLHGYVRHAIGRAADDVTQETCMDFVHAAKLPAEIGRLRALLYWIANCRICDYLRKKSSRTRLGFCSLDASSPGQEGESLAVGLSDPKCEPPGAELERREIINKAMETLTDQQKKVILLYHLSIKETAAELGLGAKNVAVIRTRAFEKLREALLKEGICCPGDLMGS